MIAAVTSLHVFCCRDLFLKQSSYRVQYAEDYRKMPADPSTDFARALNMNRTAMQKGCWLRKISVLIGKAVVRSYASAFCETVVAVPR